MYCSRIGLWNFMLRGKKETELSGLHQGRLMWLKNWHKNAGGDPQSIQSPPVIPVLWQSCHCREMLNCTQWMLVGRGLAVTNHLQEGVIWPEQRGLFLHAPVPPWNALSPWSPPVFVTSCRASRTVLQCLLVKGAHAVGGEWEQDFLLLSGN